MDPFLGSLAISGIGMGLDALFGDDEEGQAGSAGGYAVLPEYAWTSGMLQTGADYSTGVLNNANAGKFAPWYEAAMPTIRRGMKRGIDEAYYGTPGERTGTIQNAVEAGAMTGIGPKSTMAGVNKALAKYNSAVQQMDEFLASKGVDITNEQTKSALYYTAQAPRGPAVMQYGGYPATAPSSGFSDAFGSLAKSYMYSQAFSPQSSSPAYTADTSYLGTSGGYGDYRLSGGGVADNYAGTGSKYTPTNNYTNPNTYSSGITPNYGTKLAYDVGSKVASWGYNAGKSIANLRYQPPEYYA